MKLMRPCGFPILLYRKLLSDFRNTVHQNTSPFSTATPTDYRKNLKSKPAQCSSSWLHHRDKQLWKSNDSALARDSLYRDGSNGCRAYRRDFPNCKNKCIYINIELYRRIWLYMIQRFHNSWCRFRGVG